MVKCSAVGTHCWQWLLEISVNEQMLIKLCFDCELCLDKRLKGRVLKQAQLVADRNGMFTLYICFIHKMGICFVNKV